MFAAELPAFAVLLPADMQREMAEHRALEKEAKAAKTAAARRRKEGRASEQADLSEQPRIKKVRPSEDSAATPRRVKGEARVKVLTTTTPQKEAAAQDEQPKPKLASPRYRIPKLPRKHK